MSKPLPAHPTPPDAPPSVEPGFEVAIQSFWEKNRNLVLLVCAAALLAIVAGEAWKYVAAQREKGVREEYAAIADQPGKLSAFAEAHSGHALAGVANLRLADEKFTAGDFAQAATSYQKAAGSLTNEALLGRAKLGAAVSQVNSGNRTGGEAALKSLGNDATVLKDVRIEAMYHLASLAHEAGKNDEAKKLVDEIGKLDPGSSWVQRATMLLAGEPGTAPPPAPPAPAITFKPGG